MEEKERGKGWRKGAGGREQGADRQEEGEGVGRGGKRKDTVEGGAERGEMGRGKRPAQEKKPEGCCGEEQWPGAEGEEKGNSSSPNK